MKRTLILIVLNTAALIAVGYPKDSLIYYTLPDSVKANSFFADISIGTINTKKEVNAGIGTGLVKILLESDKNEKEIDFEFPKGSTIVATGFGVKQEKDEVTWKYNWSEKESYRLMISMAGDSAGNFALYSGYIFLPKENKWKLIGTCRISGHWQTLKELLVFRTPHSNELLTVNIWEAWCQRTNGSWKNLSQTNSPAPIVNLYSHIDSLGQLNLEMNKIKAMVKPTPPNEPLFEGPQGVHYTILKDGSGRQVTVNDTVTAFYKGSLTDGSLFDETKDKPATFPLNRLIRGWQIGVPLTKVGGKIRIIIPSHLAYSIRTRSAKIPPNSILVFEIEVVDAKPPQ